MAEKVVVSPQFSLQARDFVKGLIVAVGTSVAVIIQSRLDSGSFDFNWKQIGIVALGSIVAYLAKNYFTPTTVAITYKTNEEANAVAVDIKDSNK